MHGTRMRRGGFRFTRFPGTRSSMNHSSAIRVYAAACVDGDRPRGRAGSGAVQAPPLNDPATGEDYHIEGAAGLWFPSAKVAVSSERFGIPGTRIDFKADLGLTDQTETQFRLVLKPSRRSKFRFEFIPIKYESSHDAAQRHRVQRHPLSRRTAGHQPARVEGLSCRPTSSTSSRTIAGSRGSSSRPSSPT